MPASLYRLHTYTWLFCGYLALLFTENTELPFHTEVLDDTEGFVYLATMKDGEVGGWGRVPFSRI